MSATEARATVPAYGINFINKDYRRRASLGLIEQVTYTRCANAYKHLDELTAADGEERHASFTCDRPCQQCLARAGRPDQ